MKSIYVRSLVKGFLKKKRGILVSWIMIVLIFGGIGVLKAYPEKFSSTVSSDEQKYEETVQTYNETLSTLKESIASTQEQVDELQTYYDNSVLMQMDAENVQTVSLQYMVSTGGTTDADMNQITMIMTAWAEYIENGSLSEALANTVGDISSEYLSELISCSTQENSMRITVKYPDMDMAKAYADEITNLVEEYQKSLQNSVGTFEMMLVDRTEESILDTEIQTTQNTFVNSFRNYKTTVSDLQTKYINQQTALDEYIEKNEPDTVTTDSPKKIVLEYGALGVIAGIVIPFIVYAIAYTLSGRIKGKEELLAAGLNVLAVYHPLKGEKPSFKRAALEVSLLAKQNGKTIAGICRLGDSQKLVQMEESMLAELEEQDLTAISVQAGQETAQQVEPLAEAGNVVLLVETGQTTYAQLEEEMQFCKRFRISVWGCIVAE